LHLSRHHSPLLEEVVDAEARPRALPPTLEAMASIGFVELEHGEVDLGWSCAT